ncbi:hemolysin D [Sphingomonas zeicaulis]|uniref:HlyD family type I secretion periplasmic adaptor subunit n=1 Tax=Sphingomonas zeicaulis TaxID=1632740 RepID=UPI003D247C65
MTLDERLPALSRHWRILREAWRLQNAADAVAKPRSDHEFLPAALEIMEKPPSPAVRILLLGLCGLFTVALAWSIVGKVDVVAVALGKIVPSGNVKLIQPIEIGSVRAIHVKNGQHVVAGQLLIELDPTIAGADEAQAAQSRLSAEIARARNDALLSYFAGRPALFTAPPGTPQDVQRSQIQFVNAHIGEYEAQRASLIQQRAERAAELASAEAEMAKLRQTLPYVERQLAARKELSDRGYFSKIRLLEYEQLLVEHMRNIDVHAAAAEKAKAAGGALDAELARLRQSFAKAAVNELTDAIDKSNLAAEDLRKSARRRQFQMLRAPVSGTIQQLSIATIGGVVQPAQPLMVIVPDDATVDVEAQILNKDIGFVREGQPVRLKVEAFNFTDYGTIEGVVESISRDAVEGSGPDASRLESPSAQRPNAGPKYAARIKLRRHVIRIDGKDRLLGPGLAVQAEIKTSERRIIQYLLSPIAQAVDEAGRER